MPNVASLFDTPRGLGVGAPQTSTPGTGVAGPRGIEAIIEYNGLYLNVRNWVDTYLITSIGGIDDADVRDNREINPGYDGETSFPGFYGGRTITLTGKIQTRTLSKLRDMQQALRQAFSQLANELPLIFRAPTPNLDMMIYCKKSQSLQMTEEQHTLNFFERNFQIILRASNPRFVNSVENWQEKAFAGATFDAIGLTVANNGNFNAQPNMEFQGPFTTLAVTNESNPQRVALTAAIPAGEVWRVESSARRMYRRSDNANRFQYLDVNSDWMELRPGTNSIRVTATGLTAASRVTFYHRHTYM